MEEPEQTHYRRDGTGHQTGRTEMDYTDRGRMRERIEEEREQTERLNDSQREKIGSRSVVFTWHY